MQKREAEAKFRAAKALYRDKRYAESLAILTELESAFPNERKILFPKARCLMRLGRLNEAAAICELLISKYNDQEARELRQELTGMRFTGLSGIHSDQDKELQPEEAGDSGLAQLGIKPITVDDFAPRSSVASAPPPRRIASGAGFPWGQILASLGGIALLVLFVVMIKSALSEPFIVNIDGEPVPVYPKLYRIDETGMALGPLFWPMVFLGYAISFVFSIAALYIAMSMRGYLPYGDFLPNLWNVSGYASLVTVLSTCFSCIGWFAGLYIIYKKYEIQFVDLLIYIGIQAAFWFVFYLVCYFVGINQLINTLPAMS